MKIRIPNHKFQHRLTLSLRPIDLDEVVENSYVHFEIFVGGEFHIKNLKYGGAINTPNNDEGIVKG